MVNRTVGRVRLAKTLGLVVTMLLMIGLSSCLLAQTEITQISASPTSFYADEGGSTTISVLATPGTANLAIRVTTADKVTVVRSSLVLTESPSGTYTTTWNGRNDSNQVVAPGTYQFRVFNLATSSYMGSWSSVDVVSRQPRFVSAAVSPNPFLPNGQNDNLLQVHISATPVDSGAYKWGIYNNWLGWMVYKADMPTPAAPGEYDVTWDGIAHYSYNGYMGGAYGGYGDDHSYNQCYVVLWAPDGTQLSSPASAFFKARSIWGLNRNKSEFEPKSGDSVQFTAVGYSGFNVRIKIFRNGADNPCRVDDMIDNGDGTYSYSWDGRDEGGVIQIPGSYSIYVYNADCDHRYIPTSSVSIRYTVNSVSVSPLEYRPDGTGSELATVTVQAEPGQPNLKFGLSNHWLGWMVYREPLTETSPGIYIGTWNGFSHYSYNGYMGNTYSGYGENHSYNLCTVYVWDQNDQEALVHADFKVRGVDRLDRDHSEFAIGSGNVTFTARGYAGFNVRIKVYRSGAADPTKTALMTDNGDGTYTYVWDGYGDDAQPGIPGNYTAYIYNADSDRRYVPTSSTRILFSVQSIDVQPNPYWPDGTGTQLATVTVTGASGQALKYGIYNHWLGWMQYRPQLTETSPGVYTGTWDGVSHYSYNGYMGNSYSNYGEDHSYNSLTVYVWDANDQESTLHADFKTRGISSLDIDSSNFNPSRGDQVTFTAKGYAGLPIRIRIYQNGVSTPSMTDDMTDNGDGTYTYTWDGIDTDGEYVAPSAYTAHIYNATSDVAYYPSRGFNVTFDVDSIAVDKDPFVPTGLPGNIVTVTANGPPGRNFKYGIYHNWLGWMQYMLPLTETSPGVYTGTWGGVSERDYNGYIPSRPSNQATVYVWDEANHEATSHATFVVDGARGISASPQQFTPGGSNVTTVSVPGASGLQVFARVYNQSTNVLTREISLSETSGTYYGDWDGKDVNGNFAGAGTYRLRPYSAGGQPYGVYTYDITVKPAVFSISVAPDPFVPDGSNTATLSLRADPGQSGLYAVMVHPDGDTAQIPLVEAGTEGTYVGTWDGRFAGQLSPDGLCTIRVYNSSGVQFPTTGSLTVVAVTIIAANPNPFAYGNGQEVAIGVQFSADINLPLEVRVGALKTLPLTYEGNGAYSAIWDGQLTAGNYIAAGDYILYLSNSASGQVYSLTGSLSIVDSVRPSALITAGPADAQVHCGSQAAFTWTGNDNVTPTGSLLFSYQMDSDPASAYAGVFTHTFTGLVDGPHTFTLTARDAAGNVTDPPTVRSFTVDTTGPAISDAAASPGYTDCTITWTTDGPATSQVEYDTSTAYGSATTLDSVAVTDHSVTISGLDSGATYYFRAVSADACGNETTHEGTFTTLADSLAPETIIDADPAEGSTVRARPVHICWSGSDDHTPAQELEFSYSVDSGQWSDWSTATCQDIDLADGQHTVEVKSRDRAGNEDQTLAARTFTVDTSSPVAWVDWISGTSGASGSATGVLHFDNATVDVTYTGEIAFIQTSGGANYWNPSSPYLSTLVHNAPPASDIIALSRASAKTLTFSKPVSDLLFAVVSLNGNGYRFNQDFDILSYGCGYWGCGTLTKQNLGGGVYQLNGSGEPHGVIRFKGLATSITWTSLTNEYWNGFTVGTFGVVVDTTPPETTISSPAEGVTICQSDTTIDISGSDNLSTVNNLVYQWSLDGNAWSDFSSDTSIVLTNLTNGPHTFEAAAKDEQDNIDPTPATVTFTVDTVAPLLSDIAGNPSASVCTVTWATDSPTTSQVVYGETPAYGSSSPLGSTMVTQHSITLSGLKLNTTYHMQVVSTDSCGRTSASGDLTFMTSSDMAPPDTQIASGPGQNAKICTDSATFGFTGSDDATQVSLLEYSWRIDEGDWSAFSTENSASLTGLTQGVHTFEVEARDLAGKVDPTPAARIFTVDINAPVISSVANAPSQGQATVSWTTDEQATSRVEYGADTSYGSTTTLNAALVTSHSVNLAGLLPSTTYHFVVRSKDSCGHESVSDDAVLTTLADDGTPETTIASGPGEGQAMCSGSASICWTGSDNATPTSNLMYSWRLDSAASWPDAGSETCHQFTGLAEGSHTFEVRAVDSSGNVDATPAVRHFTVDLSAPVISDVVASGMAGQANVTWKTDGPATSQVVYGATSAYGSSTALDSGLVTSHSVTITGLTPDSSYHFSVKSRDGCERETISPDQTFLTGPDSAVPDTFFTSGPADGGKACESTVAFCWNGNDNATPADQLQFSYMLDAAGWSAWISDTCFSFNGLGDGSHTISVKSKDTSGNEDATPATRTFVVDTVSPAVSNVTPAARQSSATIQWISSEPTTSRVEYGTTTGYGAQSPLDSALVTAHKVTITGLNSETTYHFRVKSTDKCREVMSDDGTFTTTPIVPPNLVGQSLTGPLAATAQQQVPITWSIKNTAYGDAATGWFNDLYLSSDETLSDDDILLGQYARNGGLVGFFSYSETYMVPMPIVAPALYYLILEVDSGNAVGETNELDNLIVQPLNILMGKQMTVAPGNVYLYLNPGVPATGQLDISNLGTTALSGISAAVTGTSPNINVQLTVPPTMDALSADKIAYTITAVDESVLQSSPLVEITSSEGPKASVQLGLYVIPRQPKLVASPGYLESGMLRGKRTLIKFELANNGGVPAKNLRVMLPGAAWMSLITPQDMGTLAPGEKAQISIALNPPATLPLGPYNGSIAIGGDNDGITFGTNVGFQFRAMSENKGDLKVIASDEFTYFADDHPRVVGASVIVKDAVNKQTVAQGVTNDVGEFLVEQLMEGFYEIEVQADKHGSAKTNVELIPGQVNEVNAFLPRQLVKYTWTVEPIQIEDKYKISIEATFETHVPAPVITVDPPFIMAPVLEGKTTQIDYTITNHGLIAAQGAKLNFGDNPDFYVVPMVEEIGTIPAQSSMVVPVFIRAKRDGPIILPGAAAQTAAAAKMASVAAAGMSVIASESEWDKPCDTGLQGGLVYYYVCGPNNQWRVESLDTRVFYLAKEIWGAVECIGAVIACGSAIVDGIGIVECPDAVKCLFKYACQAASATFGFSCCYCNIGNAMMGDFEEAVNAGKCLGELLPPATGSASPPGGGGWGWGPGGGGWGPAYVGGWSFDVGASPCAGSPLPPLPSGSAASVSGANTPSAQSQPVDDISKYGGKEVRSKIRCL